MKLGTLRIRMPDGQSRESAVEQAAIGAGRASDNELVLDDISVSRRHARLTFDAAQMTVEDLGSANGSYIGSQRLAPNTPSLVPGDQAARLGDIELRFVPAEAPRPVRPPSTGGEQATMVFGPPVGATSGGATSAGTAPDAASGSNRYGKLRIKTPDGKTREFGLDQPTVTVGRSADNQLAIDEISVSRRHARLSVESGRLMIEDLGSANGTFIGGQRLAPNNPGLVSEDQTVRVGDVEIRYLPAHTVEAVRSFSAGPAQPPAAAEPAGPPLNISLVGPAQPVAPGSVVTATLTIQNRGTVVDELTVRVSGVPVNWVRISKERVPLLPNALEAVTITFQPPRRAEAVATDHRFTISVISREHRTGVNTQGILRVLPYSGFTIDLQPVRSRRDFQVVAQNQGNASVTYHLTGVDDEHSLLYSFAQETVSLQPGQTLAVPLQVLPKVAPRIGTNQTRAFNVLAGAGDQSGAPEAKAAGQLIIRPPIPIWLIPLALILLLCLCLGGAFGYVTFCPTYAPGLPFCPAGAKPVINVFTATPSQVDAGGSVVIAWDVSNAEKVEFLAPAPNTVPVTGLQTFKVQNNTTFTLRATNFAGTIEQSVDVIVKKSPPVIQTFTANPGVITAGQTDKVVISWTVLGATSVSIQGLASQNLSATGSVEVPAPTANTTYTLVATNDAGTTKQDLTVVISSANCTVANVTNGDKLNLREGPGAGYAVVVALDNGTRLDPIGRNATGDWLNVRAAGRVGWVSTSFVTCANVADLSVYPTVAPNLIPTLAPTPTHTAVPPTDTPVPSGTPAPTHTPTATPTLTPTPTPIFNSGGLLTYRVQQGGKTTIFLQNPNGGPITLLAGMDDAEVLAYTAANGGRFAIWALEGSAQKVYIVDVSSNPVGNPITGTWNVVNDANWSNDGQRLVVEATTGAAVGYYYYDANGNFLAQPSFP
jgi:pSer/pThr/pTyr-binding forkhead associated (FHA) protein